MEVEIAFGALSPHIGIQLQHQGLTATKDDKEHWEKDRKAIVRLRIRGLISDGSARQIERRLMKRIVNGLRTTERTTPPKEKS